jgi:beta-xylosidase
MFLAAAWVGLPSSASAQPVTSGKAVRIENGAPGTPRIDDGGKPIDAHDGEIQRFGDRYYLYGTQYGCGFRWNDKKSPFCGFVAYSSSDLVRWHAEGKLFDAATPYWQKRCDGSTYGCFRPHVVFNARTRQYVLWINSYDVSVGYHVFTSAAPTGPFVEAPMPKLAINADKPPGLNHGDHDVFVDTDGTAYLAFTDWRKKGDIVIEKLDDHYLSGTGRFVRIGLKATEAPSIFRRGDTYYLTFSDPNCGYCQTGTSYLRAKSPLGPWEGRQKISDTSCGGQPADVATLPGPVGPIYLYQSDRWDNANPNETHATHYWEPLRFNASGGIEPLACKASFDVALPLTEKS